MKNKYVSEIMEEYEKLQRECKNRTRRKELKRFMQKYQGLREIDEEINRLWDFRWLRLSVSG
ncbi:MAG: hypothetical protein KatS3mg079_061 [Caloramator sp.]|nr:MAG: hypothetical protein KatS3mg079_061 [Caloramator sp.]